MRKFIDTEHIKYVLKETIEPATRHVALSYTGKQNNNSTVQCSACCLHPSIKLSHFYGCVFFPLSTDRASTILIPSNTLYFQHAHFIPLVGMGKRGEY